MSSATMGAIEVRDGKLVWSQAAAPTVGVGEVLIDVAATAINRADLVQRAGGYPPPPGASPILGLECAGVVRAVGEGVTRVAPGDEVCALLAGGGYAEQVAVPAGQVLKKPRNLSFAAAAAIPEVFATAYLNLYMEANLQVGERVLLHAGASGVGTAAIQLLTGSHNPCFVTVGSQDKIAACVALGADGGHDRSEGSFVDAVTAWHGGDGVDVVLDPVAAPYWADNLEVLGLEGRLVLIGLMGGVQVEANLAVLMMKRLRVIGSTLRARSIAAKAQVMDGLARDLWPRLEDGSVVPVVEATFAISEAQAAHDLVESNATVGKVVLEL